MPWTYRLSEVNDSRKSHELKVLYSPKTCRLSFEGATSTVLVQHSIIWLPRLRDTHNITLYNTIILITRHFVVQPNFCSFNFLLMQLCNPWYCNNLKVIVTILNPTLLYYKGHSYIENMFICWEWEGNKLRMGRKQAKNMLRIGRGIVALGAN